MTKIRSPQDPCSAGLGDIRGSRHAVPLEGLRAIAAYMGKSESTMWRWIRDHDFPAAKLPSGTWVTTPELIDYWLLARLSEYRERRDAEKGAEGRVDEDTAAHRDPEPNSATGEIDRTAGGAT